MTGKATVSQNLRLHLIRHGETAWSLSGRHTGRTDIALTAQGETQARSLAELLGAVRFTAIFTSPASRARRTCELAGLGGLGAAIDPDLAEWDYGQYEGRTTEDIRRGWPGWNCYRDGCPGGESPGDVSNRADRLISRLCPLSGNVALFSHGEFGCSLAARWVGLPVEQGEHLQMGPASLSILGFNPVHRGLHVIVQWNRPASATATIPARSVQRLAHDRSKYDRRAPLRLTPSPISTKRERGTLDGRHLRRGWRPTGLAP